MSLTYNKFRRTTMYGDLTIVDYTDSSGNLSVQRDATIGGNLLIGDTSGNYGLLKYYDASSVLHTITHAEMGQLETTLATESYVDAAIATIDTSNFLSITDASNNYLKIIDASNNYAKISYVDSSINIIYTDLSNNYAKKSYVDTRITDVSNNHLSISDATANYALKTYVDTSISNLIGGASGAYDTLREIQTILQNDDASLNTLFTQVASKLSIVDASNNYAKITYVDTQITDVSNNHLSLTDAASTYATKNNSLLTGTTRITSNANSTYLEIKPGYNHLTTTDDSAYISYVGSGDPYNYHVIAGNLVIGNSVSSTNGFMSIGNGNDLSRVRRNLNIDNVLRVGFDDATDTGASFSNGARIDASGNINVSGAYTIGGTDISTIYAGLSSNNTMSGTNTFSGASNTFDNTIYANTINTATATVDNTLYGATTSGTTTICGNASHSGIVSIAGLSSGSINIGNLSTGTINIGAGATTTSTINIGRSGGQNRVNIGLFDFSGSYFDMPTDAIITGNKTINNKTILSQIGENIYNGTVSANAITINYNTIGGSIVYTAPSSNANIALTITNINPASAVYASYNVTFIIDTSTYKKCIAGNVTIGGVGYTPISANGYANISVSPSAIYVMQTFNIIYINSTTPTKIISNVGSLY